MGGTRTLIASLGASAVLVATGAFALLALSVVFAFGGWSGPLSRGGDKPAIVFADANPPAPSGAQVIATGQKQIVMPASASRRAAGDDRGTGAASPRIRPAPGRPQTSAPRDGASSAPNPAPSRPAPPAAAPPPAAPSSAPAAKSRTGDHVRQIGTSLSSTVQRTGTTLADAVLPLAPPVSIAVQTALNLVADVVRRTTDGLGNTLDALLPAR